MLNVHMKHAMVLGMIRKVSGKNISSSGETLQESLQRAWRSERPSYPKRKGLYWEPQIGNPKNRAGFRV